jgi:NAD(P) transhydrogenase
VATGSEVYRPEEVDFSDPDIDDCESIVQVAEVPRTLTVIGGGVIGSEYASIFAELGTAVTLVDERPRILSWLDAAISVRLQYAFAQRGIRLRLGERWSSIGRENGVIRTALEDGTEIRTGRLLFAAGRVGATEGLGLEDVGVGVDRRRYVKVDAGFRTAVPSVLAAGDVIGAPALASTSMEQGRVAVCRAFGFDYKQEVGDLVPMGIFTIPEVSAVGLTEEAAKAQYGNVVTGWASYARNPRSMMRGDGTGGVKLVFDAASRRLVGAHHVGDHSAELIHIGLSMITLGGTVDSIIATVFGYPTLAESYKYAAYDALGKLDAAFESPVSPVVPDA